ncbi:MAG: ABC transporter [Dictyoglomus sp. NZ13-RE01]|nr:MAG: ABC transporter [Dictyoglomus sp. NZ13-RE01]
MRSFFNIFLYRFKSFYRDRFTFIFAFLLPIIFVIIFGFVFGGSDEKVEKIKVALLESQKEVADVFSEMSELEIVFCKDLEEVKNYTLKGKTDCGVILQDNKFKIFLSFTSFQQKPFLRTIGDVLSSYYSIRTAGLKKSIEIEEEKIDVGKRRITSLGYSIPGVISFSLSSAIFTMIALFGFYKRAGILKRFAITPVNPFIFISGIILGNLLAILFSATLVLLASQLIFSINFSINWTLYIITTISTILGMMAIGIFLTAIFKEPNTANNVGNLILNIMLFFSGVYFPLDFLPNYLKTFAKFLPLYYVGRSLRISLGVEEGSPSFILSTSFVMLISFFVLVIAFGRQILETEK